MYFAYIVVIIMCRVAKFSKKSIYPYDVIVMQYGCYNYYANNKVCSTYIYLPILDI